MAKNFVQLTNVIKGSVEAKFDPATRYVGAAVIAVLGVLGAAQLRSVTGMFGVPVTILATVVAAMFGGLGPGILAALISAAGVDIFVMNRPFYQTNFNLTGVLRISVLVAISCLVSFLVATLRMALDHAEDARHEAEKASREKDAMIAFLSHDLRGPLSSISLTFQLLQKYSKMAGKESDIQRLSSNGAFFCHRMTHLIQNLLDASKIRSGGISLSPANHDIRQILSEVFAEHRLLAEEKKISFTLSEGPEGDYLVHCDQILLTQVMANLILNAFKFTPGGGEVAIALASNERGVQIQIRDNGPGIPPSQMDHLFEKFWQAKTRLGEGTGLGLFISRAIVEAHHGQIRVESELGKGTCFTVQLPTSRLMSESTNEVSLSRVLQTA